MYINKPHLSISRRCPRLRIASLHSVSLSFALSMSLSSRGKSAPELALSSSSRRVHTGRWSAALRQGCLAPWSAALRREAIVSASSLFSPLAASVSRQEPHWKMSCMCDHGAESQDDRRGEMRVRCVQPSAGALGISAALRRSFRVRCGPGVTQQSSLKEPVGDGGFFDTAPRCYDPLADLRKSCSSHAASFCKGFLAAASFCKGFLTARYPSLPLNSEFHLKLAASL